MRGANSNASRQVGGFICALGSRLVEAVRKKMQDEFFLKPGKQLDG